MCNTAAEVPDFQRKNYKGRTIENNPIIEQLSRTQKEFRIKIENSSNIEEVKKLRNIRKQTLKRKKKTKSGKTMRRKLKPLITNVQPV